jgi:hypothetical protein
MVGKEPAEGGFLAQEIASVDVVVIVVADEASSWNLDGNVAPQRMNGVKNLEMESLADQRQVRLPLGVAAQEFGSQSIQGEGHRSG